MSTCTGGRDVSAGGTAGGGVSAAGAPGEAGVNAAGAQGEAAANRSRGRSENIAVREERAGDAPTLARLSGELGYEVSAGEAEQRVTTLSGDGASQIFVAEIAGEVVGFVQGLERRLLVSEPFVELGGLVVAAAARRRGVATALLDAVETWAAERGVVQLRVRSRRERRVSHLFYGRRGYDLEKEQLVFAKRLTQPGAQRGRTG
jgi:GNAT superfamily N-acetyltransferase